MNGEVNMPGGAGYDDQRTRRRLRRHRQMASRSRASRQLIRRRHQRSSRSRPNRNRRQNMPEDITLPMGTEEFFGDMPPTNAATAPAAVVPPQTPRSRRQPRCRLVLGRSSQWCRLSPPIRNPRPSTAACRSTRLPVLTARRASRSSCVMHPDRITRNAGRPTRGPASAKTASSARSDTTCSS